MSISENIKTIKSGFLPSFWVANIMELFERIAYYGQTAILSIFLRDHLKFSEIDTGRLASIFNGLIYFLPIFAGALADKFGFKKAFSFAFLVLSIGYFMIGATGMAAFSSLFPRQELFLLLTIILVFTAIGGSFIKPSVLGTVALTSSPQTKSIGYALYYTLVNIGGAVGPFLAFLVRDFVGIQFVYVVSALSCALMLISTIVFYKEPPSAKESNVSLKVVVKNLFLVLKNFRFIVFLLIFSLYWLMYWQIYIIIPFYITDFISKDAPFEIITSVGAWGIIFLQLIVNWLTKRMPPITAIITGFGIAAVCWLIIMLNPSIPVIIAGLIVFSIGEMTQAPRYYEYIADLAPKGQAALFQGYAFLPIAIGWFFGGNIGGWLYKAFAKDTNSPQTIFLVLFGIGVAAAVLMFIYNSVIKSRTKTA
ncbi:MAG: peptide MFS transporter [Ignavibacteria bacterium]|nr:peptide MFS transporter [Ignavibacteria bacterium]MCU7501512.1 peptide MFS transporter [Ignavibacteria bacterium]MCU7515972.1 peptide MFS transporter [Ignavibacteria bacterium]